MTIVSPLPHRRGRLEIIPLIDIMFFLLAAFMLVSINKIHVKSLKVNLPTNVPTAQIEKKEDFVSISVNADGQVQIDKTLIADKNQVLTALQALYAQNKDQKFLISADKEARSGDLISVLGTVRAAGFQKIAFSISTVPVVGGAPAGAPAIETTPASAVAPLAPAPTLAPPTDAPSAATHP